MAVTVLDCSHWQTITDWAAIRNSGVVGMIHKVSQGWGYRDPRFRERRFAASGAGVLFGRYHFGDGSPVSAQVDNFLEGWDPSELLALDWEDNAASQMTLGQASLFAFQVHTRTGIWPLLYTGNTLKDTDPLLPRGALLKCRLWLAQWGDEAVLPKGWDKYWLWQYANDGTVPGITGEVDMNRFEGTEAELRASWELGGRDLLNPAAPQSPVVVAESRDIDWADREARRLATKWELRDQAVPDIALSLRLVRGNTIAAAVDAIKAIKE